MLPSALTMGTTIARRIRQLSSAMEPRVSRMSGLGDPLALLCCLALRPPG